MSDYLTRFRAASTDQRREAILKLGQSDDTRAIPLLEQIAAAEPDPALKTLARWAVQHLQSLPNTSAAPTGIFHESNPAPPGASPPIAEPALDDLSGSKTTVSGSAKPPNGAASPGPGTRPASEQQKQLAKSRLDYAVSLHIAKQERQALSVLAEAAAADPTILESPVAQNLAAALTGEARERAMQIVRDKSHDPTVVGQSARAAFKLEPTSFEAVFELLGLFAIVVLVLAVIDIGLIRGFNRVVDTASSGLDQLNANDPRAVGTTVAGFGALSAALTSLNTAPMQATLAAASPPLATSYAHLINNPDMATLSAQYQPTPANAYLQVIAALQPSTPTAVVPGAQATALAHVQAMVNQLAIPIPPARTVLGDSLRSSGLLFVSIMLGLLTIYIVGLVIGGVGSLLRFVRYMTRAYLGIYGALLIALLLLYFMVTQTGMPGNTQIAFGIGAAALFLMAAIGGFIALIFAAARGHQFGLLRGFISLLIGSIVFSLLVSVLGI